MLSKQLAQNPDAVVTTIPHEAVLMAVQRWKAQSPASSRTALYTFNSGYDWMDEAKAQAYFGQNELDAGRRAGRYYVTRGPGRVLGLCGGRGGWGGGGLLLECPDLEMWS